MGKFGKLSADGALIEEATVCILTDRAVDKLNSVREKVKGTPYFYRVIGHQYDRVTDENRAKWIDEAKQIDAPKAFVKPVKGSEVKE